MKGFLEGLDRILADCGIPTVKEAAAASPQPHDFPGRETVTAKEPPAPLDMLSGVDRSDLPVGTGRLEANGSPVTPVVRALGGKTAAETFVSLRAEARASALRKLGFSRPEQRFQPFGPSKARNDAVLLGFCLGALRTKQAGAKVASSALVPQTVKAVTTGAGPEAVLQSAGPNTVAALRNTLLALIGAGGAMYGAKQGLVDLPAHVGKLRTEAGGQPFMARPPGVVSGFEAFPGGGAFQP